MNDRLVSRSRRRFVSGLSLAGTAGLLGISAQASAAEPPPETTRIRLSKFRSTCQAPLLLAEELLRAEGFTRVEYVQSNLGVVSRHLAAGEIDIGMNFVAPNLIRLEAGDPAVILAGGHVGCFELIGAERIRSIRDLKGKSVAIESLGAPEHVFLSAMAASVGLDPRSDIKWVTLPPDAPAGDAPAFYLQLFTEGRVDAFMGFPPMVQEFRAKKIGHVVVDSTKDRPWSQYFCCLIVGHREFVRKHPVATKRAVRAILKSADLCALEPDQAAQRLVDGGFATASQREPVRQMMRELPYGRWRELNVEDTVRFYALRLHEAGLVTWSPQKFIAQGTDWRFLNELKRELKG
jgi:NitT/TauT family transport system substrate-binding protein